jgi:hypothetical protein
VDDLWALLGDPRVQATLSWAGGGLAALAGGVWAVVKFLAGQKGGGGAAPPPPAPAPRARIADRPVNRAGELLPWRVAAWLMP